MAFGKYQWIELFSMMPTDRTSARRNVGLLSTESGTLGRAVGDVILTLCGAGGLQHVLNYAFGAMSVFSMATIAITLQYYRYLAPSEKDE